jgi:hypothetical protein
MDEGTHRKQVNPLSVMQSEKSGFTKTHLQRLRLCKAQQSETEENIVMRETEKAVTDSGNEKLEIPETTEGGWIWGRRVRAHGTSKVLAHPPSLGWVRGEGECVTPTCMS